MSKSPYLPEERSDVLALRELESLGSDIAPVLARIAAISERVGEAELSPELEASLESEIRAMRRNTPATREAAR